MGSFLKMCPGAETIGSALHQRAPSSPSPHPHLRCAQRVAGVIQMNLSPGGPAEGAQGRGRREAWAGLTCGAILLFTCRICDQLHEWLVDRLLPLGRSQGPSCFLGGPCGTPVCTGSWRRVARWEGKLELGWQGLKSTSKPQCARHSCSFPQADAADGWAWLSFPCEVFQHRKDILPGELHGALGRSFSGDQGMCLRENDMCQDSHVPEKHPWEMLQ